MQEASKIGHNKHAVRISIVFAGYTLVWRVYILVSEGCNAHVLDASFRKKDTHTHTHADPQTHALTHTHTHKRLARREGFRV